MSVKASENNQKPIKILMTADAVGGVWQYSMDLLRGLGKGAQTVLATFGPRPSAEQKAQLAGLPQVQLRESDYALEWMKNPWHDVGRAGEWLLSLQREFKADIIHLNGYAHAALPWEKPVVAVAHSCVYSWWHAVHNDRPGAEWTEYYRRVADGLSACNLAIAPSRFMAEEIKREYLTPSGKVRVIHNFSAAFRVASAPRQPYCLAAGRLWDQAKNVSVLAEVAPHVSWPIYLAGDEKGPNNPVFIPDSFRLLGRLPNEELLRYMSRGSIFIHPALYEPFGLAVLEAARAGCCLVLADIPSLRELWAESAVFVDPRKPEAWINELNHLITHPERRLQWGHSARKHAARYSRRKSIRAYRNLYRSLMNQVECGEAAAA